ncbi:hypothetical protein QJS10_CPA05g00376 [Acorus calamus]|uniref:Uncharacterized protein n=1 Tax=Acorus calamus TaxID=4465 RepID=A0AAV9EY18_ACOCL|nr:hypothetical protein QJS10_CPA05g00376 [Acorus calamus]
MGLLDKLWDETVAGPMPDSGLKKLRKHNNFSFRSVASGKDATADGGIVRSIGDDPTTPTTPKTPTTSTVTRRIMIIKPPSPAGTPPASPAGSTPPVSPFFGGRDPNRFRRKSSSVYERGTAGAGSGSSAPPYDV